MSSGKIFLIGMPGGGKSTIGKLLGKELDIPFIDLDIVIEKLHGKPITKIFTDEGEGKFRQIEASAFADLISGSEAYVLATGGGTPCFFEQMQKMNDSGTTVYLDTPLEELIRRTQKNKKRPLLKENHRDRLTQLLADRRQFYEQASIQINTAGKSPNDIVAEITHKIP